VLTDGADPLDEDDEPEELEPELDPESLSPDKPSSISDEDPVRDDDG